MTRQDNYKRIKSYADIRQQFKNYLDDTDSKKINFRLVNQNTFEVKNIEIDYLHRWTEKYRRRILARMYKLEDWYKQDPCNITFFTFTTKQRDFKKLEEQYAFLKTTFQKVRDVMRKTYKKRTGSSTFNYFWVIEPHKSGFIHLHMMTFCEFTDTEKEKFINMWCEKYEAGKPQAQKIEDVPIMRVDFIRTYLFKYLSKNLYDEDFNLGHSTYNSVAWFMSRRDTDYTGIRFFGSSQELTKIMKLDTEKDDDWICESVTIGETNTFNWTEDTKKYLNDRLLDNNHGTNRHNLSGGFDTD